MNRFTPLFSLALCLGAAANAALAGGDPPVAKPELITNSIGMKLARIPAGAFLMGSPDSDRDALPDEKPQHQVKITRPFYLGVTTVTVGQFRAFVKDTGYKTEGEKAGGVYRTLRPDGKIDSNTTGLHWANPGFPITDEHPVFNVDFPDAVAFCKWLSKKEGKTYRLPTEAEWEYACRAGTTTRWSCGDDRDALVEHANINYTHFPTYARTDGPKGFKALWLCVAPVGRFRANAWGLHDMHGNVWQWCSDWYAKDYYATSPTNDPPGPEKACGVHPIRGGVWARGPLSCRSANRYRLSSGITMWLGFRVVMENEQGKADGIEPKKTGAKRPPAGKRSTTVTEENYKKIEAAVGKWTEADVIALLGPAHRFRIAGKGGADMIWEDVSRIRVEFVKGKATFLWGQFAKQIPSRTLNLENFRKLREGMTEEEVKAILGPDFSAYRGATYVRGGVGPFDDLTVAQGTTLYVWQNARRITVQFTDGKVSGHIWMYWFMVKD